jgi:sulfatase maturation enzyme AslB (radical SAM superfamily)
MDEEKLLEYFKHKPCLTVFPFGGEPLLNFGLIERLHDFIENEDYPSINRKHELLRQLKSIITNGILIPKLIEKLKKYDIKCQISLDGIKEAHDLNRVFPDGSGSWDKVIEAIETCEKYNVKWSIHGVCNRETLKYFAQTTILQLEIFEKYRNREEWIRTLRNNCTQVIFEEEYTDEDIDILINEYHKIADYIDNREDLTINEKKEMFENFFLKRGGVCGAGCGMLMLDHNLDIYPCHRNALVPNKEIYNSGNALDIYSLKNFRLNNSYYHLGRAKKYLYSAVYNNDNYKGKYNKHSNWCPTTNYETSNNIYYENSKYNLLTHELNRAIEKIMEAYYGKCGRSDNGIGHKCDNY